MPTQVQLLEELLKITDRQLHDLNRRRMILTEELTRARTGTDPLVIRARLMVHGITEVAVPV